PATPSRANTSYAALVPPGPVSKVEGGWSSDNGLGALRPATIATVMATAKNSASPISVLYDMLPEAIGRGAELEIAGLVARHGAEHVAVQPADESGQRGAARLIEPRFADVLGGRLGRVVAKGARPLELEHHRDEAVRQRSCSHCRVWRGGSHRNSGRAKTSVTARRTESTGTACHPANTCVSRSPAAVRGAEGRSPLGAYADRSTSGCTRTGVPRRGRC